MHQEKININVIRFVPLIYL